jgi:hypothetical protein
MKQDLNRLFGYTSSHCNLSIALTAQNPYDIDPELGGWLIHSLCGEITI